jgi:hypothetical protein
MGATHAAISQMQAEALKPNAGPPRRWNRGVVIRFVLAIVPTVAFAIVGAVEQHLLAH